MGPTQRSLKLLRELGYTAQVVEKWNPYAKVRQDLFDCIDIVACGSLETLGVQATSGTNVSKRIQKAKKSKKLLAWLLARNVFEVWGWRKMKKSNRWEVRRVRLWCETNSKLIQEHVRRVSALRPAREVHRPHTTTLAGAVAVAWVGEGVIITGANTMSETRCDDNVFRKDLSKYEDGFDSPQWQFEEDG